jgi:hypothetical protein
MIQGYFERSTAQFMNELWTLLIDAQNSMNGIVPSTSHNLAQIAAQHQAR